MGAGVETGRESRASRRMTMPKDATKNVDRYKIGGGHLNEYEFGQEKAADKKQKATDTKSQKSASKKPASKKSTSASKKSSKKKS